MNLNKERMRGAYPATPNVVKDSVEDTLYHIGRESAKQPPRRYARRLSFATTLLIVLVVAVVAIAAGAHFGVFDFMARMFGTSGVLPEAEKLVQTDLGSLELAHIAYNVDEAVYDGGTLHVVYSVTQKGAAAPLHKTDVYDPQSDFYQALRADQAHTECDWFYIDGTEYTMTNCTTGDTMPGENNGELLCYLDIQLASAGIVPEGDFKMQLPLVGGNGTYQTLDFTVKADQTGFESVTLYGETATVTLQSAFVSPVRTYATIHVEINAGVTAHQADETFCDWAEAELVDAQGNELASLTELIPQNLVNGKRVDYSYTFLPVKEEEVYLAPTFINEQGEWAVDMNRALPLK